LLGNNTGIIEGAWCLLINHCGLDCEFSVYVGDFVEIFLGLIVCFSGLIGHFSWSLSWGFLIMVCSAYKGFISLQIITAYPKSVFCF
jgi:hypothetical protein